MIDTFKEFIEEHSIPEILEDLAAACEATGNDDWAKLIDKAVDTHTKRQRRARRKAVSA